MENYVLCHTACPDWIAGGRMNSVENDWLIFFTLKED